MISRVKPIKQLEDLKDDMPRTLIVVHKDSKRGFTLIGHPQRYNARGLVLEDTLLLTFVIDIPASKNYDGISEMYSKEVAEGRVESWDYNPRDYAEDFVVELFELSEER